jgi:hypothetical protein
MKTNSERVGTPQAPTSVDTATEIRRPHTCAALHAAAALLSFRATARDHNGAALGVLVDSSGAPQHLTLAADGAWSLSDGPTPFQQRVLLYESAANVLRGGALNPDGTVGYAGSAYVIEPSLDGQIRTARVCPR